MAKQAIRRTANALSQEGELLNLHAELKDVARALEGYTKEREEAVTALLHWADRKEDVAVQDFIRALSDLEIEMVAVDRQYHDHFKIFVKLWKGILSEKKDLNAKIGELKKVRSTLDALEKKASKADVESAEKRKKELQETQEKEKQINEQVAEQLLKVQKDKHQSLRTGYTGLYQASMSRLKECVKLEERVRVLVNAFPRVVSRNEDGSFVTEPFSGPSVDSPVWWQGEQLHAKLQEITKKHEHEIKEIRDQNTKKMAELLRQQESMQLQWSQTHSDKLSNLGQEHSTLLKDMQDDHARALNELETKIKSLEAEAEKTLKDCNNKYALLETELKTRNHELLGHIAEENKLEECIAGLKVDAVQRAVEQGSKLILVATSSLEMLGMEVFYKQAETAMSCADNVLGIQDPKGDHVHADNTINAFAVAVAAMAFSAAHAARCSRAEDAHKLIEALDHLNEAANAVIETKKLVLTTAEQEEDLAEAALIPKVLALYAHKGKVQDGFTLMGFDKGEELILLSKRDDGWSKVQKGTEAGWAPTSYLKDLPPPPEQPAESKKKAGPKLSPNDAVATFRALVQSTVAVAQRVQRRDKELAALGNTMADDLGSKVSAAQQAIMDALNVIEKLRSVITGRDTGRHLEVNTTLLKHCQDIQEGMREVIRAAESMKKGLETSCRTMTTDEFNAKHLSWLEGLTAAVDTVVEGNPMLTEALRAVIDRKGRHEELQVASRNIAAGVAQLAALSRTKTMPRGDESGSVLESKSNFVIETSRSIAAATRESQDLELASVLLENYDNLSANQAKRLQMATQVNVLKLEKDLEMEREKLGRLRRLNYGETA